MAYPNTITQCFGASQGQSGGRGGKFGGEWAGNQYWFLISDSIGPPCRGDKKVHAWKATDQGQTWTAQDDANAPTATFLNGMGTSFTVAQDGSKFWLVYIRMQIASPWWPAAGISAVAFDASTDTWGSVTDYTSPNPYPVFTGGFPPTSTSNPPYAAITMAVRGANDYEVSYSGLYELDGSGNALGRVWTAKFDGSTFGAEVMVDGQAGSLDCFVPNSSGGDSIAAQIAYQSNTSTNPLGGGTLYTVSRDAAGAFGAVQQVDNQLFWGPAVGNIKNYAVGELTAFTHAATPRLAISVYRATGLGPASDISVYYADSAVDPVWAGPSIVVADPVNSLDPEAQFDWPTILGLNYANGSLVASWFVLYDFVSTGNFGPNQTFGYAVAAFPPVSWSAVSNFSPDLTFDPSLLPAQIASFGGADGVFLAAMSVVNGFESQQAQSFLVPLGSSTLQVFCNNPPTGYVGSPYSHDFTATGGTP